MANLLNDKTGSPIQAFPLTKGKVNITSSDGTILNVDLFHCVEDGTVTITWIEGGTTDISCIANDDFTCKTAYSIAVQSGIFHIA